MSFRSPSLVWGLLAAAGLLWPSRAIGLLDGIPLDGRLEALCLGLLLPALLWLAPAVLNAAPTRALAAVVLVLKLVGSLTLAQQGWCARFETQTALAPGAGTVQLSWDARADWRSRVPRCSAIMTRPWPDLAAFPAWFLNLPDAEGRPPYAVVMLTVDGYLSPRADGQLTLDLSGVQSIRGAIGPLAIDSGPEGGIELPLPRGMHAVHLEAVLTGSTWRFAPRWNGRDLFTAVQTNILPPRRVDGLVGSWIGFAISLASLVLIALWLFDAVSGVRPTWPVLAWTAAASAALAVAGWADLHSLGRLAVPFVAGAVLVPLPERLRNMTGAILLVGVPWLVLCAAAGASSAGRFSLYTPGDDWVIFQRYAHRVFMQGYWLEGGQLTFWYQPLYRWTVGALHVVFGDSSVGELYLDAAAIAACAMFAFAVAARFAGFAAGIISAALTLATIALGPTWWMVGRGLSEIASAGCAYVAALAILRNGADRMSLAVGTACLAAVSFYLRLNNLPFVLGVAALALPLDISASALWNPRIWWPHLRRVPAAGIAIGLAVAVLLLALRTWYYTGLFSAFYGTQREYLSTIRPFESAGTAIGRMLESVLMVVTVQDPPRFDLRALPVVGGVAAAVLAVARVPLVREVPAAAVILCLSAIAGATVARGTGYVGRFSFQLIPVAITVFVCTGSLLLNRMRSSHA